MRSLSRVVILMAVFAFALGCGRKPAALLGTWNIDVEKMVAEVHNSDEYKKAPENGKKRIDEMIRTQMAGATLTFSEARITMSMGARNREVDYKVTAHDGDKWTIETTEPGKKPESVGLTWIDNDHITITPPGPQERPIHLVRSGAAAASPAASGASPAASGGVEPPAASGSPAAGSPGAAPSGGPRSLKERLKEKVRSKVP